MKKIHFLTLLLTCGTAAILLLLNLSGLGWFRPTASAASAAPPSTKPVVSAPSDSVFWNALLQESWQFYKARFMADGAVRVVSNNYGGTISEGQSYALLKALWMNEPKTFEGIWRWTKANMQRPHDHLLGWQWSDGTRGGRKGLVEVENASDADQDIAYALLLAGKKWNNPSYTRDGLAMARDIWRLNVQALDGRYYLTPGTWEGFRQERLTLDPSYFAPYVYRQFAEVDTEHAAGWNQLADDIYDTLEACTRLTRNQLPPNWCAVKWQDDHQGSRIIFSDLQGEGARDFGYDAFRVYWRMAMDAKLSPSPGRERALAYLKNHPFLLDYWQQHAMLPEGFTWDGRPRSEETSGFAMGPALVLAHFNGVRNSETSATQAYRQSNRTTGMQLSRSQNDLALYRAMLGPNYNPQGYWFNDYNDFLHSVIWLHLYAISLK